MKIEHIALYVDDLENARDFFFRYLDAFSDDGFHSGNTGIRSCFLRFESGACPEIMQKSSRL